LKLPLLVDTKAVYALLQYVLSGKREETLDNIFPQKDAIAKCKYKQQVSKKTCIELEWLRFTELLIKIEVEIEIAPSSSFHYYCSFYNNQRKEHNV